MKKVVFITGASRGIGLATVKRFLREGWNVAAFYNKTAGPDLENCKYYRFEISDMASVNDTFEKAYADFGRVDSLVNCAGLFGYRDLMGYDEKLIEKVVAVNEKGTYFCTKAVLDKLQAGSIVNVSSTAAQIGSGDPVYAGAKAAILGFTKSMAKALAPKIRVNAVSPGVTNTDMLKNQDQKRVGQIKEMTLLKKIAEPEDIANAIYFLASDESGHITGACLDVNGGYVLR